MRSTLLLALFVLLPACQSGGSAATNPKATASPLAPAIDAILTEAPLLVLGEVHGTSEVPRFALDAVQAAAARGHSVALGLEWSAADQSAVDAFLASEGTKSDRAALLASEHWDFGALDGRGSVAMLELIDGIRAMRASGTSLPVVCFVPSAMMEDPDAYESSMAAALVDALERDDISRLIVVVGNAHAGNPRTPMEGLPIPMARFLREALPTMVSLNLRSAGGSAWFFGETVGAHSIAGLGDPDAYGVELFDAPNEAGFDGVFDVGTVSASSPAKPEAIARLLKEFE